MAQSEFFFRISPDRVLEVGVFLHQLAERRAADLDHRDGGRRADGRRARLAREQGHLTEDVAAAEAVQQHLLAIDLA